MPGRGVQGHQKRDRRSLARLAADLRPPPGQAHPLCHVGQAVATGAYKAVEFINQLSKVYRYLLDNQNSELVTVEQELLFIRSYIFLLDIRFGHNLIIRTNIKKEDLSRVIPPMALQILIENAIKHNETSSEFPLSISVVSEEEKIIVTNNLQLRPQHEPGSQTGLQNIRARYQFFTALPVEVIQNPSSFIVKIPLLSTK